MRESSPGATALRPAALPAQLYVEETRAAELRAAAVGPSWDLLPRQVADIELLADGVFAPLTGPMTAAEHAAVCADGRLPDGRPWPVPVLLDVSEEFGAGVQGGNRVGLRDPEGVLLAVLDVSDVFRPYPELERTVLGAAVPRRGPVCLGGRLLGLARPGHPDYAALRSLEPVPGALGWWADRVPHAAEQDLIRSAASELGAPVLLLAPVGTPAVGDAGHHARVRALSAAADDLSEALGRPPRVVLVPLPADAGGNRALELQAVVARGLGATRLLRTAEAPPLPVDLGIEARARPLAPSPVTSGQVDALLEQGRDLPAGWTTARVAAALRADHRPRSRQGFTVLFTGLSGSGKSTIANLLVTRLLELGGRTVSLLDGDLVRKHLSSELGFSREHRDLNVRRIGYVASEITKAGGIAVCAPIAPYDATRRDVRAMVTTGGGFVLVHVATPLEVCEARDRKGFYAQARAGLIKEFTGVSDPYEEPADAEVVLDTGRLRAEEGAEAVLTHLRSAGYLPADRA